MIEAGIVDPTKVTRSAHKMPHLFQHYYYQQKLLADKTSPVAPPMGWIRHGYDNPKGRGVKVFHPSFSLWNKNTARCLLKSKSKTTQNTEAILFIAAARDNGSSSSPSPNLKATNGMISYGPDSHFVLFHTLLL